VPCVAFLGHVCLRALGQSLEAKMILQVYWKHSIFSEGQWAIHSLIVAATVR